MEWTGKIWDLPFKEYSKDGHFISFKNIVKLDEIILL